MQNNSIITFTASEVSTYYSVRIPHLKQSAVAEWRGPCPIHQGKKDSFAVQAATGRWCCHSKCGRGGDIFDLEEALVGGEFPERKAEVFRLVGRIEPTYGRYGTFANGIPTGKGPPKPKKPTVRGNEWVEIARYPYVDEDGSPLYYVVRFSTPDGTKVFRQCRPDGDGGFVWDLKGARRVPYRLPEVLKADTIYLPEGEKDANTLEGWGFVASCNPGGTANSHLFLEWKDFFAGKHIVIPFDNDGPGRKHAVLKAAALLSTAASVKIVELPDLPEKGDVTDWRDTGGTAEKFRELVEATVPLDEAAFSELRARWGLGNNAESTNLDRKGAAKSVSAVSPFRLTEDAVLYCDPNPDKEPLLICGRLEVAALTCDTKGDGWGRLLRWRDSNVQAHQWAMPMSLLAGDGNEYRQRLLDGGLYIAPGRKARELLTVYLQTMKPERRALCAMSIGWHKHNFVLPDATIGPEGAETILFQSPFEADHHLNVSGTVDDWRESVGRFCSGNSRLILSVSCAFAGPLLSLVALESGGVHLVGPTSTGKSTALLVGGSVLGGGGRNGFVQSWRATGNGLEAIAANHNDLTLFLDELAQLAPNEAAEIAYLLGNGTGKSRMNRAVGARKKLSWSLMFVSAGEITLSEHAQTVGKRTRAGAEVRLLNIDADAGAGLGLFENIHGAESADAFSRQLKDATRRFYGAPLRAFLDSVARDRTAVEKWVREYQLDFVSRNVPSGASGEVFRAAQRFALIAAAGRLATDLGVTGWELDEAEKAAACCLESWITCRGTAGAGDAETAVNQVRRFIEAHGPSRFQSLDSADEGHKTVNRAGFRKTANGETEYWVLPETFKKEVCAGFDYRMVVHVLEGRGFLERQSPSLTKRVRAPGNGEPISVFCLSASILED
jgi:putative DNA primase/helicase